MLDGAISSAAVSLRKEPEAVVPEPTGRTIEADRDMNPAQSLPGASTHPRSDSVLLPASLPSRSVQRLGSKLRPTVTDAGCPTDTAHFY